MLPASIQVCPVELPGRGRRQGEAAINDVARLADLLADSLPLQVCFSSDLATCDSCPSRPCQDQRCVLPLTSRGFVAVQDKPYALFGTCLGAIIAYEITRRVRNKKHAPMPVAFFPSAVSAPHLYAIAVMKLYVQHHVGAARTTLLISCRLANFWPTASRTWVCELLTLVCFRRLQ